MESVKVVVDDAGISEYFYDDEEDLIISHVSNKIADPSTSKQTDTTLESKDKLDAESDEKQNEPETPSFDLMVPNIIK